MQKITMVGDKKNPEARQSAFASAGRETEDLATPRFVEGSWKLIAEKGAQRCDLGVVTVIRY